MNECLKEKIEEVIGEITSVELLADQGETSEVYKLETFQGVYVLKSSYEQTYRTWLAEEAKTLDKLNQVKEIPTPYYHGYIEQKESSNLIMSHEKGVTLTAALKNAKSTNEKKRLIKSFGGFLNDFHEREPIKELMQADDWLDGQLLKAQSYVDKHQTSGSQELLNELKVTKPKFIKQAMIHGDCTTDNVFVKRGEVGLFIDVAGMAVGDPRYDISLAIRSFKDNPELLDAFYESYTRYKVSEDEFRYFDEGLYEFF